MGDLTSHAASLYRDTHLGNKALANYSSTSKALQSDDGSLFSKAGLFENLYRQSLNHEKFTRDKSPLDASSESINNVSTVDASLNRRLNTELSYQRLDIALAKKQNLNVRATQATLADNHTTARIEQFRQRFSSAADHAASVLGTTTNTVLAFAAHESGWGMHMPGDNASSNNLFGIKAKNSATSEERVSSTTTEVIAGKPIILQQDFRRYRSTDDSVADFAKFLLENPRYQTALPLAGEPEAFIRAVHNAGYATDPAYADKVIKVWQQLEENPAADQQFNEQAVTLQSQISGVQRASNNKTTVADFANLTQPTVKSSSLEQGGKPPLPAMLQLFGQYAPSLNHRLSLPLLHSQVGLTDE